MFNKISSRLLLAAGLGAAFAIATPALAQEAMPMAANVPMCSATVTDQCMQGGGMGHKTMGHKMMGHKMMKHHHMMKGHMMKGHMMKHTMAKPAMQGSDMKGMGNGNNAMTPAPATKM